MSARPTSSSDRWSSRRALTVVAVVAAAGGIALSTVAFTSASSEDGEALTSVEPAIADVVPSTVAPRYDPVDDAEFPDDPAASDADTAADGNNLLPDGRELSPLADLLDPSESAIPESITPRPAPRTVVSDVLDLGEFPVRAVGLEADGQMEIPNETEIGWYRYGAAPGQPGATVLAAHVTWNRSIGPFFRLGDLEPGNRLEVALDDGTSRAYEVIERTMYPKDGLPRERIWRTTGDETLVLITCGGDFNPSIRRFSSNIVVYAVPVAHSDVGEVR